MWPLSVTFPVALRSAVDIFVANSRKGDLMTTAKKTKRSGIDKLIYIRIDENTHRKLKTHAASTRVTIQQLVEELIRKKCLSIREKDLMP